MARSLAAASVLITLLLLVAVVPESRAHTDTELDSWLAAWSARVWLNGEVDRTLLWQFRDLANRHPCYFREECPPPVPTKHVHSPASVWSYSASVEQWRPLVAIYFRAGDVDRALRIMQCESGGDPNIMHDFSNPASASGLMQHLGKYWSARSAAAGFGGASIFDPTANVAVAAWLRDQPGGWSHWVCR